MNTKDQFVKKVKMLVDFWENNEKCSSTKDRLDGLAFSILYLLDGKETEEIKKYIIESYNNNKNNISGELSDLYFKLKEGK